MSIELERRIRNVTAVLGPTNTGKTHLAIERMLGHETGVIGLPLRLLAREVYDKIVARVGADKVALVTGEEKIKPESPRYWVSTVEAMPRDVDADFLAIDEIQLAADADRGHVFTDRLLHARGNLETLLLGASTMRDTIADLIPGANFISRPRLSKLSYAGEKKITRLPTRSAVVSFSANDVYAIAELIRRQRGGAAVVLGALSPRTRNAQVALYQSGDVDFLVATDAVGMGLNLDVDHVAFAQTRKFDGQFHRELTPSELGQIAGRAGRHMNDGTFGVTGGIENFSVDMIERLENHTFDSLKTLQWRARDLDFAALDALRDSLRQMPKEARLQRARMADDTIALEAVAADREIVAMASGRKALERLWDVCQIPDYRKISAANHAELVSSVYKFLMGTEGRIPEDWFAKQVALADRTDGDIDTLSNRLSHIRTWTFVANRADWLKDPADWQGRTRAVEDSLSDALHLCLTQRFVDKRTSALMKGMRDKDEMAVAIADDGVVMVENHFVGRLKGFRFTPDPNAEGIHGKAARTAASHVLAKELAMRARRVSSAKSDALRIGRKGVILWRQEEIAHLAKGDNFLNPQVVVLSDEHLSGPDKEKVQERLNTWITELIGERLKPLIELAKAEDVSGLAKGIAFRMTENFGVLRRETVAEEMRTLDQPSRGQLRKYGIRFGAFNIFFPVMLKPAAVELAVVLWALQQPAGETSVLEMLPEPPRPGLTSVPVDAAISENYYRVGGFHVCGPRAVRVDMLERLADQIRPLIAWRTKPGDSATPPKGTTGDGGFVALPEMMSVLGCSSVELVNVLKALGFRQDRKLAHTMPKMPQKPTAAAPVAETTSGTTSDPVASADDELTAEPAVASAPTFEPIHEAVGEPAAAASPPAAEPSDVPVEPSATADAPTVVAAATPVAVAPNETAAASPDPAAVAPVEPSYVDIWRPRRRHQEGERPQTNRAPGDRERRGPRRHGPRTPAPANGTPTGVAADETTTTPAPVGTATVAGDANATPRPFQRRDRDRRDNRQGQEPRPATATAAAPGAAADGRRDGKPRFNDRNDRPGGNRDHRRDGGGSRDPKRRDREERPNTQYRASPQKAAGAESDSPFAALMALKAELEKSGKT